MSQSTVLPPAQPKAADLAAPSGRATPAAGETTAEGASFGEVLQSQIDKGTPVTAAPAVVVPVPAELLIGAEVAAAAPEVALDPAMVNALAATTIQPLVPVVMAPASNTVERTPATMVLPDDVTALSGKPVESRSESLSVAALEAGHEDATVRARPDTEGHNFGRQLIASMGGESVAHAKVAVEAVEPMIDAKAAASGPPVPVENTPQSVVAADPRREVAPAAAMKVEVAQPLTAPGWRDAFADRVSWVANTRQPTAEMQINPPNLGPVEIRVSMNADQASLSFYSPHASVRDAIQSALPRLTEAFAATGLTLGNVFVGAESQSGQNPAQGEGSTRFSGRSGEELAIADAPAQVSWLRPGVGLGRVDLFA